MLGGGHDLRPTSLQCFPLRALGEDTRHRAGARRTYSLYERMVIVTLIKAG